MGTYFISRTLDTRLFASRKQSLIHSVPQKGVQRMAHKNLYILYLSSRESISHINLESTLLD